MDPLSLNHRVNNGYDNLLNPHSLYRKRSLATLDKVSSKMPGMASTVRYLLTVRLGRASPTPWLAMAAIKVSQFDLCH